MNKKAVIATNAMQWKDNLTAPVLSRRDFLTLVTRGVLGLSGVLGLGMLLRYLGAQSEGGEAPLTWFDLGPAADFPAGSRTPIRQAQAVVLHTSQGFAAFSLVCPHLGCTVNLEDDSFACPCHGSRFHADGSLQNGPAASPLKVLRIEETGERRLILHID